MQYEKTEQAPVIDIDALDLNEQEKTFAHELALGTKQAEAYRKAYGAENYQHSSVQVAACRKAATPRIKEYVTALRSVTDTKRALSLDDAIADEEAFAQRCENAGNYGAAGAARDRRNKLMGYYVERLEVTAQDPLETLRAISQVSPQLAAQLAQAQDIPWPELKLTEH